MVLNPLLLGDLAGKLNLVRTPIETFDSLVFELTLEGS